MINLRDIAFILKVYDYARHYKPDLSHLRLLPVFHIKTLFQWILRYEYTSENFSLPHIRASVST